MLYRHSSLRDKTSHRMALAAARTFPEQINSAAVLVVYDGYVAASWGQVEHKYFAASVRKSLLSALYGIHVAEGTIELSATLADLGIDDAPVALTGAEKQARIVDLLKARSGIYIPPPFASRPRP
ncbi:MAG TPA: hypothetical protein QF604_07550 [Candidatus Latescibacteria bacterium]|nr:hypothetical protein [Candidatus Latescibacterota bacterium]HJN27756.1 hypothetical protein [Candidatus Latescibacterota bacterium]